MPAAPFVIYGATGFTGRLLVERAVARGHAPLLAGRDGTALGELAGRFGLRYRVAALEQTEALRAVAALAPVLLNAAGPFETTMGPLLNACLAAGTHYADITGEVLALHAATLRHAEAQARGVMVMPAVGFDVVPSDCLAAHVARRLPEATTLRLGLQGLGHMSRGSARTIIQQVGRGTWIRRDGGLQTITPGSLRHDFDFGDGARSAVAVSWGDVVSAFFSTGIPNIEVFFAETLPLRGAVAAQRAWGWLLAGPAWQKVLRANTRWLRDGPSPEQRRTGHVTIVAEAVAADGRRAAARLRTPEVYRLTAASAIEAVERMRAGQVQPGFQTPSRLWGPDFALSLDGVSREDLPS